MGVPANVRKERLFCFSPAAAVRLARGGWCGRNGEIAAGLLGSRVHDVADDGAKEPGYVRNVCDRAVRRGVGNSRARLLQRWAAFLLVIFFAATWLASVGASEPGLFVEEAAILGDKRCTPDQLSKIEAAIPDSAVVQPAGPRRLLIFDVNVGYPGPSTRFPGGKYPAHVDSSGHLSIAHANAAFALMGRKTGAFEVVVSRNPAVFRPENLKSFDAVFFNNTVGNPFDDPELRRSLMEFVCAGGGLMGVHGASLTFTDWHHGCRETWPEFGVMLGARGANHRQYHEPITIRLDDPDHPLNRPFGGSGYEYASEFFRFSDPYSRNRVRVLQSIDAEKTDLSGRKPERADGDYALAWVRNYGRGRVFYGAIGHDAPIFWDRQMLQFYLGAIQFVLGDLPAPTTPSARLTPALRAQEQLGWRLAVTAYTFHKYTLFEAIDKTAELGVPYLEGLSFQKVSQDIPKNFEPTRSDEELEKIRLKFDAAGVRLLTYYYHRIPGDEAGCRKVFEFGRKMGIETFLSEPLPESLDVIEKFCEEYGINVALHNHDEKASPHYWHPKKILEVCEGRSPRIGACGDLGYWMRSGIDPIEAARMLGPRLITIQMHDLDARGPEGHDVPWGTGVGQTAEFLGEIHSLGLQPTAFGLEYSYDWFDSMPEMRQCIDFFNDTSLRLSP